MTQPEERIRMARDVIGSGHSDADWRIAPTEHAELFAKQAPSLADNLSAARPQGLAESYEGWNDQAMKARDLFKNTVGKANLAIFVAAVLSAVLLATAGLHASLGTMGSWFVRFIGPLGLLSGGLAAMWLNQARGGQLASRWAEARAKAEAKRLTYFKAVMEGASQTPEDQLLALEYVRRFLLDNHIDYFRDRGRQHDHAANRALQISTQAVFLSSAFTALAGALSMWHPQLAVVAALGVIASAYAALSVSTSAVNQDRKNADRYRAVEDQLRERKLDLDIYRLRTAKGDAKAVQEFYAPIFVALEADHKAFLTEADQRELAIGDMEKRLDSAISPLQPSSS